MYIGFIVKTKVDILLDYYVQKSHFSVVSIHIHKGAHCSHVNVFLWILNRTRIQSSRELEYRTTVLNNLATALQANQQSSFTCLTALEEQRSYNVTYRVLVLEEHINAIHSGY